MEMKDKVDNTGVTSVDLEPTLERIVPGTVPQWAMSFHAARYAFAERLVAGKAVLDCACGVGYGSNMLFLAGASRVVGVDVSQDAIRYAQSKYSRANLMFTVQDAQGLDFPPDTFDLIVSFETIEHLQRPTDFLSGAVRALKPEGIFIGSVPNKAAQEDLFSPFHEREYDLADFRTLLGQYFEESEYYWQICPDLKFKRAREMNRMFRRTHLLWTKRLCPSTLLAAFRAVRNWVGERENRAVGQNYYQPRPLVDAEVPEDAFVLLAICKKPIRR